MYNSKYGIYKVIDTKVGFNYNQESMSKYLKEFGYSSEDEVLMSIYPTNLGEILIRQYKTERHRHITNLVEPLIVKSYRATIFYLIPFFRAVTGIVPFISREEFGNGIDIEFMIQNMVEKGYIEKSDEIF